MSDRSIRVVIVDDHELIREGVKKIARFTDDICVVGEAGNMREAIRILNDLRPDIVILDLGLDGEGVQGLAQLHWRFPRLPVLVLSMHGEERFALTCMKAGAVGYVTKSMASEELVKAVRSIRSVGRYISPAVADLLAHALTASPQPAAPVLSAREREVLALLAKGRQAKQIAAELGIAASSVHTYRTRIREKLGLTSTAGLIRYAIEHRLVD